MLKRIFPIFLFVFIGLKSFCQDTKPSAAIIEIKTVGLPYLNEEITEVVRFELEKIQKYQLLEKEDMDFIFAKEKMVPKNCYNELCLVFAGKTLAVDKVLSGSVSKLGDNKLITFKIYDIKTEQLENSKKIEIISDPEQSINLIINSALHEFYNGAENYKTLDLRVKTSQRQQEKEEIIESATQTQEQILKDYGNFFEEEKREKESRFPKLAVYTRPSTLIEGFSKLSIGTQYSFDDLTAVKFQYAYIFESNKASIGTINGREPGVYSGYEFRGELLVRIPQDYFDYESMYSRFYFSFEAGIQKKFHKEMLIYDYINNVGTIMYEYGGMKSRLIVGNLKMGVQNIISNRIYIDPYFGIGIRSHSYSATNDFNMAQGFNLQDRLLPNFVAGVDIGILLK